MSEDPREPYSWDAVEIGLHVGYISQLNNHKSTKRRHPLGFAPPKGRQRKTETRPPGSFPEVPYFDEVPDA